MSKINIFESIINWIRFLELKSFTKQKACSNLLDLGCGNGLFLQLIRRHKIIATGIDKSPSPAPYIITSSIETLKLNEKFDVVTIFHVLEHTENPFNILKISTSFLKKNGTLVIEVPLIGNATEQFLKKEYFAYHDPSHIHFFTKKEIYNLIEKIGFTVKQKGFTLLEFPFTLITSSFRKGVIFGLMSLIFFIPFKALSLLGLNDEIIRLYCVRKTS